MQGSLIFVVIVAVWAAYLVQHWVRRREEAAQVRSVAGFSQAMRVLQKRPLLPSADLAAPRPHSYTLTPARRGAASASRASRGGRVTVEVKRAVPVGAARSTSALTARTGVATRVADHERDPKTDPLTRNDPAEVEPMPHNFAPQHPNDAGQRQVAISPSGSAGSSVTQRRLRVALLLVALLWVPVSIVLAAKGLLTWFSVLFALLTVGAVLFWLRTEAAADRGARSGRSVGSNSGVSADRAAAYSADDTQAVATHAYATPGHTGGHGEAPERAEPGARRPAAAFFDGQARESAPAAATSTASQGSQAGQGTEEDDLVATAADPLQAAAAGTWSPVPVPRPTYAMKAKAAPRMTESGIPADVFATPEFADEAEELDERGLFARRATSG